MIPSTEQLEQWTQRDDDGWVRVPESAWDGALWLLSILEKIEDDINADAEMLGLLRESGDALDDLCAWIVNDWEWDQKHYDEVVALRHRIADALRKDSAPNVAVSSEEGAERIRTAVSALSSAYRYYARTPRRLARRIFVAARENLSEALVLAALYFAIGLLVGVRL